MVADETTLYVGTSQGMVVAIPIASLSRNGSTTTKPLIEEQAAETEEMDNSHSTQTDESDSEYLNNCALALHVQKDSRVKSLLHLQLPTHPQSTPECTDSAFPPKAHKPQYNLPDVQTESPSVDFMSYGSLIISAGKGHMEYGDNPAPEDALKLPPNYTTLREKNEEHQLLVWGHKL